MYPCSYVPGFTLYVCICSSLYLTVNLVGYVKDHRRAAAGVDYEIQLRQEQVSRLSDKYAAELARHLHSSSKYRTS